MTQHNATIFRLLDPVASEGASLLYLCQSCYKERLKFMEDNGTEPNHDGFTCDACDELVLP